MLIVGIVVVALIIGYLLIKINELTRDYYSLVGEIMDLEDKDFTAVENKSKKSAANSSYQHVNLNGVDYLFTEHSLEEASTRADKNREDIPK